MPLNLKDKELIKTKALPAASANNASDGIDLNQTTLGDLSGQFRYRIACPAVPALVDTKTITLKVQDSADGVNYNDLASLASVVLTGAGGAGAAAKEVIGHLPPTTRRHVRGYAAVEAAGGDNTAVSYTFELLF